jgi:molybdenum cofactor cytidylyltransferase
MSLTSESHQSTPLRLAILILAAGEGSRLGGYPKALLKKSGHTLLKRFLHAIQRFSPVETLLVTGFYSDKIEAEIKLITNSLQNPVAWVQNQNPRKGQASSVRLGIESLTSDYDVLLIALCDQPNIGAEEIESLLERFKHRAIGEEIVLPVMNDQRGNPVLFSRGVINQILEIPEMVCRPYMDQHPNLVQTFVTNNQAYVLDVDTLNDIQKLGLDPVKTS